MENLDSPSPQIKDGKMAGFCPSRAFFLDLGEGGGDGGFAVPFYYVQDCSSIAGMLLAQLPVERCNSQQSGFGSLQVEFLSTAWVAALTATISFSFTMFMQLALNQHLLVPQEAKFVCMKMGIQKFDKLLSIHPPPNPPASEGRQKIVISQILASHFAQVLIVSL